MFLPLFIAILLRFATPTNTNHNCHNSGTVTTNSNTPGDPGSNDPGSGGDTGGETGHVPPIKP